MSVPTPEETFCRAAADARRSRRLSQAALGQAMRARGFPWSQATVWSVEAGDRRLSLNEAVALSGLLDVPLPGVPADPSRAMTLGEARRVVEQLTRLLADA